MLTAQCLSEGADASDCKKLRVLYFWACPSVHRSWLSGPGARLQVKLIDAVTSSGVAGIGLHMGPLLLSSEEALPSPGGSLRKVVSVALSTMNTTDLPSPEVGSHKLKPGRVHTCLGYPTMLRHIAGLFRNCHWE